MPLSPVTGYRFPIPPRSFFLQLTVPTTRRDATPRRCERHQVNGVQLYPTKAGSDEEGEEGHRAGELCVWTCVWTGHDESPSPFSEERSATHHRHQLAPTTSTRSTGMWVTGLSSPAVARPSPLPEAFPTNCSCERTTTKTKEDPEPPESVILLRRT